MFKTVQIIGAPASVYFPLRKL